MIPKKKVIIVDDHDMFRQGVITLLNNTNTIEVVAEARNGKEFIDFMDLHQVDAVLMDIAMPVMDGIEATRLSIEKNAEMKILALSMFGDEEYYLKMVKAGVKGFVLKTSGINELEKAILEVSNNQSYFSNELLRQIIANFNDQSSKNNTTQSILSHRETDVLRLVVDGLSNEEISKRLNISLPTVKTHKANLLSKTGCNNSASLVMYAIKHKIVIIE